MFRSVFILGLGREAVAIDGDLQGADVHAVELHVRLAVEGHLLLGGDVEECQAQ